MLASESDSHRPGTLWVRNLDWPAPDNVTPRIPAHYGCLDPGEIEALARVMQPADPVVIQQRLAAGKRCYVAHASDAIVAYGWVSWGEEDIGEFRLRFHLMPGEAYIWDCATVPSFRRLRLYTNLLTHIAEQLHKEGLCRVWIGADADNVTSQMGIALAGFQPVADLVVTRVIGLRQFWVRGRDSAPEHVVDDARRALLGDRDRAWRDALSASDTSSAPGSDYPIDNSR